MEPDLWQLPELPEKTVLWKDQPISLNTISGSATHLRTSMAPAEVKAFYEKALVEKGWKFEQNLTEEFTVFTKGGQYMYVCVINNGLTQHDVYLVRSPESLAVCRMLRDYFLKTQMVQDAPGKDMPDIMRYPDSKRRFSLAAPDAGGVMIYEAQGTPSQIAAFYRKNLAASGWSPVRALSTEILSRLKIVQKDVSMLLFRRGEENVLINIVVPPEGFPSEKLPAPRSLIIVSRNIDKQFETSQEGEE